MTPTEHPTVRPGQTWADNDPRCAGRTLRVDYIVGSENGDREAVCTVTANAGGRRTGHQVRIKARRFKPTSTGYRLVSDAPEEAKADA